MLISPSMLSCDLSRMKEEVIAMEKAGADWIHLDIMDGNFVPNITFGAPVVKCLRPHTSLPFDVHLMTNFPDIFIDDFVKAGADIITFHIECVSDVDKTLDLIRKAKVPAGIALRPITPASAVIPYLPLLDMVLVMTVEPGFGGQAFMQEQMDKLSTIHKAIQELGKSIHLQVDGGIDNHTAPIVAQNGADVLVAGSSLFRDPDYPKSVRELREAGLSATLN